MVTFATVAELGSYRGETITDNGRATVLLESASALIQAFTKQTLVAVAADTMTRRGTRDAEIVLPQRPVTAVTSVTLDGTVLAVSAYSWSESGRLWRTDGGNFGTPASTIVVVYSHGYATNAIPHDVRAVTLQAASRGWDNPSAVQSEGVGDYSVVYGTNPGGGVILTEKEQDQLYHYKNRARTVEIGT